MPVPYRAVVLDMDGVLIDSEPLHDEALRRTFAAFGMAVPHEALFRYKGQTEAEVFGHAARVYGDGATADALRAHKEACFETLRERLSLVPGVRRFLERAAPRFRIALTTSGIRANQAFAFDRFDLGALFDVVVTAEDITRSKPDPEPYLVTAERLGLPPGACLVVEDAVHGVRSAAAAGCTAAGLTTTFDAETLSSAGAAFTIAGFDELADRLEI